MFGTGMISISLPLASLIGGFMESNLMGKGIVLVQLASSIVAAAIIIGKNRELSSVMRNSKRFMREFLLGHDVLDYYLLRKKGSFSALELIYERTCERMVKLLDPDMRRSVIGRQRDAAGAALSAREIELVRSTCEHTVQDEELRIEYGMGLLATIVTASPMLGLLGTVWGVLDAFADMGSKGTVLLSVIAPSISSALVTTVVGLLVAIPSAICYNNLAAKVRQITTDMVGFADELMGRIACEFQGRTD
ncbi:MAG TPA: MotA/TolQ/ExbB proton channel family protein [Kiritimatiellia bacterium]|jgi:biopolymer transport protein TolQ|nr:MotA/TolQ/ExbB proton channel family protein [Kiritimatiellia bacterium]HPC48761.1 MotA/TolQ/ExbB proton channel family protein [Kiritimatiellia bacterium]HPW74415.1 MotA/TolQ/ExbB proton channel family protein [Kiritimatiellia bacterium]HRU19704.1 MotA/TolQ/ExbB proton channel family protein [Kiritimatiellia bacterium]